MLDAAAAEQVEGGLGDWMPVDDTSTAYTGRGFQRGSYLAFANISSLLGEAALAKEYAGKAASVGAALNARFLDAASGTYQTATAQGARNDTQCGQAMALFTRLCPDEAACDKALGVLAENARHATAGLPHACQGSDDLPGCADARGGPGAHLTAGLFGIKWVLMRCAPLPGSRPSIDNPHGLGTRHQRALALGSHDRPAPLCSPPAASPTAASTISRWRCSCR